MDDFKKILYGVLVGFILLIVGFVSFAFLWSCGLDFSCKRAAPPGRQRRPRRLQRRGRYYRAPGREANARPPAPARTPDERRQGTNQAGD